MDGTRGNGSHDPLDDVTYWCLLQEYIDMDGTRGNGLHDPLDDIDCDGPKHALVRDVDGSLLGSSPLESSIVPYAELR